MHHSKEQNGQLRAAAWQKTWTSLEPSKLAASLISLHAIYTHRNISRKNSCLSNQFLVLTGPEPAGAGTGMSSQRCKPSEHPHLLAEHAAVITCARGFRSRASDRWQDNRTGSNWASRATRQLLNHEERDRDCR